MRLLERTGLDLNAFQTQGWFYWSWDPFFNFFEDARICMRQIQLSLDDPVKFIFCFKNFKIDVFLIFIHNSLVCVYFCTLYVVHSTINWSQKYLLYTAERTSIRSLVNTGDFDLWFIDHHFALLLGETNTESAFFWGLGKKKSRIANSKFITFLF